MIHTPKIIGICGFPLHGKSTAQRFLSLLGVEARDDAELLRQRVVEEFNLTWEDVTTQEGKARVVSGIGGRQMTVRQLLGDYGQIYGEQLYGPNYWVDEAIRKLREDRVEHPVSFGSLRRSQASAVKDAGGFIIEILDPRKPMSKHYFDEFDRDYVDVTVVNDGTEEDLAFGVLMTVSEYLDVTQAQTVAYVREFFSRVRA